MSQQTPASPFRRTLVAAATLALSTGCATTAVDGPGHDGGLGDSLARAGQRTVGFGQTVWHRTGYLLGLHDDPGVPAPGEAPVADAALARSTDAAATAVRPAAAPVPVAKLPLHLDEVDLALMEEDAVMPGDPSPAPAPSPLDPLVAADPLLADAAGLDVLPFEDAAPAADLEPVAAAAAGRDPLDPLGLDAAPVAELLTADTVAAPAPLPGAASELAAAAPAPASKAVPAAEAASAPVAVVAANDLEHRVGETETLWDIAKRTTGDATNWHTLADVNDLGPGAAVYPGQVLTIPADMLRPELAGGDAIADAGAAPAASALPDEPAAATEIAAAPAERLTVPTGDSPVATPVTEPADGAREFPLGAGETLWDFAKRTTGDATNWQTIATQNGFDEREAAAVYEGQRIFVPAELVVERDANGAIVVAAGAAAVATPDADAGEDVFVPIPSVGDTQVAAPAASADVGETVDASASVLAGTNGVGAAPEAAPAAERDIRIVEAAFTGGAEAGVPEAPAPGTGIDSVTVSGTYYPKAVYADADFSAGLLMRVSPGTRLTVSKVEGKWYEVQTERGTGWVHERDVK